MGRIQVSNLSKAYKQYPTRWSRLAEWTALFGEPRHQLKWVLQDINFSVERGEAVGIIGINGAGKSTLLKLISGTTQPTTGRVEITGRVAAMLELGMGFHPDFTGRQNAFMAGQLIGLTAEQIDALMPEIEAFAEIGEYINQPVRVYSSGMQMRLAFSVATARRPDVLIVDEILSVGDIYFQHKSFDRIRQFRKQGTTLLIVSHDKSAVQTLCDRVFLLEKGRIIQAGEPEAVMDFYNALIAEKENQNIQVLSHESGKKQTISGTGEAAVEEIVLLNSAGQRVECVNVGEPIELRVRVRVYRPIPRLVLGYVIRDRLGQYVYGTNTHYTKQQLEGVMPGQLFQYRILFPMNFGPGSYSISTALVSTETHLINNYEWKDLALLFTVANLDKPCFVGNAWVPPVIQVQLL